jgi:hypothetical protein
MARSRRGFFPLRTLDTLRVRATGLCHCPQGRSTLSAVAVVASDDGLHCVDPDERHLRISMSEVDRAATLKLNRARNLNLHLPAAQ